MLQPVLPKQTERGKGVTGTEPVQALQCNVEHSYSSPAEKRLQLDYWKHQGIPMYCRMVGGGEAWMEAEFNLLEECKNTSGPHEVYYKGPVLKNEPSLIWLKESYDAGKAATIKRRGRMHVKIKEYSLLQTRHTLRMKERGGPATPALLFALDHLLKWYDDGLQSKGLEPSNLRHHLREYNSLQRKYLYKEAKGKEARGKTRSQVSGLKIPDLNISPEERVTFCQQMRVEISKEKNDVGLGGRRSVVVRNTEGNMGVHLSKNYGELCWS